MYEKKDIPHQMLKLYASSVDDNALENYRKIKTAWTSHQSHITIRELRVHAE